MKGGLLKVGVPTGCQEVTERLLEQAVSELGQLFDPLHGGFGEGPKFPTVPPLSLMCLRSVRTKDSRLLDMVLLQLRRMADGGLYDHLGGGFHRYSVDAEWKIAEKMLYDNAQLVRLYLDGWRLTKEEGFRRVVEETLDYVRRELMHSDGAFLPHRTPIVKAERVHTFCGPMMKSYPSWDRTGRRGFVSLRRHD